MKSRRGPAPIPVLLATGNRDKQGEFRRLLQGLPLQPVSPEEIDAPAGMGSWRNFAPEETGDTHEAIARDKAAQWSQAASMLAIASDGGLVIPALGPRWESRYTHRFAGPAADDSQRLQRLLELMRPLRDDDRRASWAEALALADRGRVLASWELTGGEGVIDEQRAETGPVPEFWAFTVWRFPQFDATYSQLTAVQRESIGGHWDRLRRLVRRYLTSTYVTPDIR